MIEVLVTAEFEKQYRKLPKPIKAKAEKQEQLFRDNPFHSSLHTEKLIPKTKEVWSFRVDRNYRILFRFVSKNKAVFLTTGPHSWIYNVKF
jgi:proteic killer suppression protein